MHCRSTSAHDPRMIGFWAMTGHRRGGPWGRGGPFGDFGPRGPRARRGDVRTAILVLLAEEPRNGYGLMQEIEERSGGLWKPSAGSIYPALAQLEDEGLVRTIEAEGRKLFELSPEGAKIVAARGEDTKDPWHVVAEGVDNEAVELMHAMKRLGAAVAQVAMSGSPEHQREARDLLADVRKRVYGLLSED